MSYAQLTREESYVIAHQKMFKLRAELTAAGLAFCPLRPSNQTTDVGDRVAELLGDSAHGQGSFRMRPKQGFFARVTGAHPLRKAARRAAPLLRKYC